MKKLFTHAVLAGLVLTASSLALAKLPALNDEAKAKAAEAAAKTGWAGKVGSYKLCKSQDKVAASYYKSAKAAGKETKAPVAALPACADPGAFVYTVAAPAAAGAPSPAATAPVPPSSQAPAATIAPEKKS